MDRYKKRRKRLYEYIKKLVIILGMEDSVKNHADAMIFYTAICAEASQSCIDCRAKFDILLAVPSR